MNYKEAFETLSGALAEANTQVKNLQAENARLKAELQRSSQRPPYVYGLKAFASLLGCSERTAARLKASGKYNSAITQVGALIIIDTAEAQRIKSRAEAETTATMNAAGIKGNFATIFC